MTSKLEKDRQRRAKKKARAIELLGGKCVNCGSIDRLQFDHINNDRDGDENMICRLINGRWERLEKELQKCQLLCISCHAIKTGANRSAKEPEHGSLSTYINRKCRCLKCVLANTEHTRQFRRKRLQLVS